MSNCGNCKYWKKPENDYGEVPGTGRCMKVVQYWNAAQWSEDYENRVLRPEYEKELAFVQDGSDYCAELKTFANFGCVQYEQE